MNNALPNDNFFWRWFSKIGDFLGLSVLWLLCCIPVLTIAPSSIALYDSVAHCVQGREDGPYRRFFRTLKKELLRGIGINVLWLILITIFVLSYSILYQAGQQSQVAAIYSLVYLGTMLIPTGVLLWLIPIESRFKHNFFSLHKTAASFAFAHLPTTAILFVVLAVAVALTLFFPILIVLTPAITVTIQCWFIERVFQRYMPEEPTKDSDDI